jgi:hypothetical protein
MVISIRHGFLWGMLVLLLTGSMTWPPAQVTWHTRSELGVAGYVIERGASADGPWARASGLIAAGEDPFIEHDYRFTDFDGDGIQWYRLTEVNLQNEWNVIGVSAP